MSLKILIVDDEPITLDVLKEHLKNKNHEIDTALNGRDAMQKMKTFRPQLLLTDINMPVMNGLELMRNVRLLYPDTVIVVLSAVAEMNIILDVLKNGARDYILKPDFKGFYNVVEKVSRHLMSNEYMKEAVSYMHERLEFCIPCDIKCIGGVTKKISNSLKEHNLEYIVTDISTALDEALFNAMLYGSLGFTKAELNGYSFDQTRMEIARRQKDERFRNRKIRIKFDLDSSRLTITLTDEGNGFDWRSLPDYKKSPEVSLINGHGLLMVNLYMSEVKFNEKGNEITMSLNM